MYYMLKNSLLISIIVLLSTHHLESMLQAPSKATKLALAAAVGDIEEVEKLLNAGVSPNEVESNEKMPIFFLALNNREIAPLFLTAPTFDPNLVDPITGISALAYAIMLDNKDSIETARALLWKREINVNIPDKQGLTALDHAEAKQKPNPIIIRLLEGLKAKRGK